jgi:hypothetical protein
MAESKVPLKRLRALSSVWCPSCTATGNLAKTDVHRPSCISRVVQGSADSCASPLGEVNFGRSKFVSGQELEVFTCRVMNDDARLTGVWEDFERQSDSEFGSVRRSPRAGQHIPSSCRADATDHHRSFAITTALVGPDAGEL